MNVEEILQNSFKIWSKLSEEEKNILKKSVKRVKYNKGDIIYHDSKACLGLIIINKGTLRAFLESDTGKQITLYKLYKWDICLFSAACVMKDITFDINLECEEDIEMLLINTDQYTNILNKYPTINNYVTDILSSRFSDIMWILEQFVFHSLDKRLATYLLEQQSNNITTTHEKIANELGSAREVISRMLKHFENDNIVKLKRNNINILNTSKLEEISK